MKKVNYSGSSKVIIRLCQAVNDLIDRGGGGHTIQNSSGTDMTARTNLQFTGATVSDDAVNDRTVVAISGGGHTIQDADGTDLTQRDNLQFVDAHLTDDALNDSTIVEVVDETTEASFDLIDETDADNDGIYVFETSGASLDASQVSYDNTVSGLTATDVQDAIDEVVGDIPTDFVSKANGGTFGGNLTIDKKNGTTATVGQSVVFVGNNKGSGVDKNSKGTLVLYSDTGKKLDIQPITSQTADQFIVFPDNTGTLALTSDIPDMTNVAYKNVDNAFTANQTIDRADGTAETDGVTSLYLGNNKASGTVGNSKGQLQLFGSTGKYIVLDPDAPTSNRRIKFPNAAGTLFLKEGGVFTGNVSVVRPNATTTSIESAFVAGNSTADGTEGASHGCIAIYGKSTRQGRIRADNVSGSHRDYQLPNASGTLALDYEVVFDITSFKNGWTGSIRVTHNKYTKITSLSGILQGGSATSNIFADATTDGNNTNKIPVPIQAIAITPNQIVTSYPIIFSQVSGNDWQASMNKAVGSVAICAVYLSAA